MMSRIRTIKPEFWTSEQIAECSPIARLLFIGIWTYSDDNGIHPASIKRLKMEVFPADSFSESDLLALIRELIYAGLLLEYEIENSRFWLVTGWKKHQRIDRPTFKHPQPKIDQQSTIIRRTIDEHSTTPRDGMESKGKEVYMSGKPDCIEVLNYLNSKADRGYRPVQANLRLIAGRLKEGATVEDCKAVIDVKVLEWLQDSKMSKFLRPGTLFKADKFAQYSGEIAKPDSKNSIGGETWE